MERVRTRPETPGPPVPRVLYVDDDPRAVELFIAQVGREFTVATATDGPAGINILASSEPFAVVVSDMHMAMMNGIAFLSRVEGKWPESVRLLMTGQPDMNTAIQAVNEGHIFRFLIKPVMRGGLLEALRAAAKQYDLVVARRVLLEQTLRASIKAMSDILALASPAAFGRATRAKDGISLLLDHLKVSDRWEAEVAAMLSQVGCVSLPPETALKIYEGQELEPAEKLMANRLPALAEQLVAGIPQMGGVAKILRYEDKRFDGGGWPEDRVRGRQLPWGSRALKILLDYDTLVAAGQEAQGALDTMRDRLGWYDPSLLNVFAKTRGAEKQTEVIQELLLKDLLPGMVLAEDVRTSSGMMLVGRGAEVTPALSERLKNLAARANVIEPVRVLTKQSMRP
ncbi:MAG TPA: HD domain-containing phosphohydrolase [Chloroflexota bacterium]